MPDGFLNKKDSIFVTIKNTICTKSKNLAVKPIHFIKY